MRSVTALFALASLALFGPGCVANHLIEIQSTPEGAFIEINGESLGRAPLTYTLVSAYAEKIWPKDVTIIARRDEAGWKEDKKTFARMSELPQKPILFINVQEGGAAPPAAPDYRVRKETNIQIQEFETLEEQKERERRDREGRQGGSQTPPGDRQEPQANASPQPDAAKVQ